MSLMPGAVRARPGTWARHPARLVEPEQIMTKAKAKTQSATEDNGSPTKAAAPAVSTKRPPGADQNGAAKADPDAEGNSAPAATIAPTPKPPRQTKSALLRTRLSEPGGASLASLIALTGWQAHTLRAALSGLRKEGLSLTRRRDGGDTIYAIEATGPGAPNADGQITVPEPDDTGSVLSEGANGSADLASASVSAGDDA